MVEIQTVGTDPGSVYHGVCHLSYRGMVYRRSDEGRMIKVPDFVVLNWSLWDLKHGILYTNDAQFNLVRKTFHTPGTAPSNHAQEFRLIGDNMAAMVSDADWLLTRYSPSLERPHEKELPILITESQCGHVKNVGVDKLDIYVISTLLPMAVRMLDLGARKTLALADVQERLIVGGQRKYGFPKKTCDSRKERKELADEIVFNLLTLLGLHEVLGFLEQIRSAQKKDFPKKPAQTHDMCDALLLALYKAMVIFEKREKRQREHDRLLLMCPDLQLPLEQFEQCNFDEDEISGDDGPDQFFTQKPPPLPQEKSKKRPRAKQTKGFIVGENLPMSTSTWESVFPSKKKSRLTVQHVSALSDFIVPTKEASKKRKHIQIDVTSDDDEKPKKKRNKVRVPVQTKYKPLKICKV